MPSVGWPELIIILVIALLLFGTTRLAGLGKASGRAIREFKEETKAIKEEEASAAPQITPTSTAEAAQQATGEVHEAEIAEPNHPQN
ncbi:TatA/E family twin arginine-targeting protein translocase [Propionibacterium sp. oral taxon 192 str. F0372]|uniref:twin-arginine translocase TatA/TatE family subunit n=1 Tax=Propionibacterium sp. oral taxon 192 TaxID=671222 RepID=UPI00035443D4|nr:twin-arginine translocase TatA/TatE family subunit [Propionibacterium sp. oral taxon 192]EPH00447.1 TatA/E family twin arginine-targeting protein translocase [Propionibacterium sp. oral taxon 192 str. F0372]